jgi:pimeloyl-ACP methyl ester carboxylesterase
VHQLKHFNTKASNLRIAADRWCGTNPELPPVVLLHGGGQTRQSWRGTAQRLSGSGREVVALDLRGHGDSDWAPDGSYRLDDFVKDLLDVVASIDRPPVLVGASLGGITSLVAVGEHPGIATGLVMVDVVVHMEDAGIRRIHEFMTANLDGFVSLEDVVDAIAAYNANRARPANTDSVRKNVRLGPDGRWRWHWDPAFMAIDDEPQRLVEVRRLEAAAGHVEIPTLIVRGSRSDVVSDAGMQDVQQRIPHADVVQIANAGHMLVGDDNDIFSRSLEAFLSPVPDA